METDSKKTPPKKSLWWLLIIPIAPIALFVGLILLRILGRALFDLLALFVAIAVPLLIIYGVYRLARGKCPRAKVVPEKKEDPVGYHSGVDFARIDRRLEKLDALLAEKNAGKGGSA